MQTNILQPQISKTSELKQTKRLVTELSAKRNNSHQPNLPTATASSVSYAEFEKKLKLYKLKQLKLIENCVHVPGLPVWH